jgi:hypothetical protein
MERADQVLAGRGVDAGLAADRRVDHAEQRGGHRHPAHPAQPGRGDEAGQVGHRAAADPDDRVGPGEVGAAQRVPARPGHLERLGRLGVGHLDRPDGQPGRPQCGADPVGQLPQRGGVHDGHLGRAGQQRGQAAEQVRADEHLVGLLPGDVDRGHVHHRGA